MLPQHTEVLIVGAGPTGLMLATWLTHAGIQVQIIDAKAGPTQESRAIAVQARTLEFYDQLGLGEEAVARGRQFGAGYIWVQGQPIGNVQLGLGADTLMPHPAAYILTQDQNEAMLIAHLQRLGVTVAWETQLLDLTQDADTVTATVQHAGQTKTLRASYLAGCDGAHSSVRSRLGIPFLGDTYPHVFFVADVTATGKLIANEVNLDLDAERILIFFPMPGTDRYRVIGQVLTEDSAATFDAVRPQVEAYGLAQVEAVHWFATYRVHHLVARHFQAGRCFLVGDAAHVHSPVGGQGMNTGLGDAVNLAWKLAQALRSVTPALLASYEEERLPFAQALVKTTDRVFGLAFAPSKLAGFTRTRAIPAAIPLLSHWSLLTKRLFLALSQTSIAYPQSPLSAGRAGSVRGGERLPWVPQGEQSNFAALTSLRWQLHVYGTATNAVRTWCEQFAVPFHTFPFTAAAYDAGITQDALYIVRPDGYLGLVTLQFEPATFAAYGRRWLPKTKDESNLRR